MTKITCGDQSNKVDNLGWTMRKLERRCQACPSSLSLNYNIIFISNETNVQVDSTYILYAFGFYYSFLPSFLQSFSNHVIIVVYTVDSKVSV